MLTEPEDLDPAELRAVLERHWGLEEARLEYLPVGFGSHHWRTVDSSGVWCLVTVDDLQASFQASPDTDANFEALDRAYRTASWLHDEADLEFIVAPRRDESNACDLERRLQEYDDLAVQVRESSEPWVVTHGEPHRANVIRDPQGGVRLVDWDRKTRPAGHRWTLLCARWQWTRASSTRTRTEWVTSHGDDHRRRNGAVRLHRLGSGWVVTRPAWSTLTSRRSPPRRSTAESAD